MGLCRSLPQPAGARGGIRTPGTGLRTPLLYPLSYAGKHRHQILAHMSHGFYWAPGACCGAVMAMLYFGNQTGSGAAW